MSIEAMRQALEALMAMEFHLVEMGQRVNGHHQQVCSSITVLRAAIEHYDQTSLELCEECGWKAIIPGDGCLVCARQNAKPVAYVDERIHGWPDCFVMEPDPPHTTPLYTEPREWVGLTDADRDQILIEAPAGGEYYWNDIVSISRAIEAKLKEKNT